MNAPDILHSFRERFGNKIKKSRIEKSVHKIRSRNEIHRIWMLVDIDAFRDVVRHLCEKFPYPHFAVASGYDDGKNIVLIYHFSVNYESEADEIYISLHVVVPKSNPVLPTITDLIPGALVSERELQEMLGVRIDGIPDSRRLFLDKDFPKGVYPWRRDRTGPDHLVRNLHRSD